MASELQQRKKSESVNDCWPGRRIPEAMHSMTRRRASPGPSGRLQVAMAFSQISSKGWWTNKHKTLSEGWTKSVTVLILLLGQFITRHTYRALLKDKLKIKLAVCIFHVSTPNIILILRPSHTQPLRGCHTGSRLHMSLRILKTMTQDLRSVTLA